MKRYVSDFRYRVHLQTFETYLLSKFFSCNSFKKCYGEYTKSDCSLSGIDRSDVASSRQGLIICEDTYPFVSIYACSVCGGGDASLELFHH